MILLKDLSSDLFCPDKVMLVNKIKKILIQKGGGSKISIILLIIIILIVGLIFYSKFVKVDLSTKSPIQTDTPQTSVPTESPPPPNYVRFKLRFPPSITVPGIGLMNIPDIIDLRKYINKDFNTIPVGVVYYFFIAVGTMLGVNHKHLVIVGVKSGDDGVNVTPIVSRLFIIYPKSSDALTSLNSNSTSTFPSSELPSKKFS